MNELLEHVSEIDALSSLEAEQFYAFAYAQYQNGDLEKASDAFQILCARLPLVYKHWFGLGATLQEAKNYRAAMRAWAMAAILEPKNPYPHFHAAECACSLRNFSDAKRALEEAKKRMDENHPLKDKVPVLQEVWANE